MLIHLMYNGYMSNITINSSININALISILIVILMFFSACSVPDSTAPSNEGATQTYTITASSTASPTDVPTPTSDPRLEAQFSNPRILGSSRVILCAGIHQDNIDNAGFLVMASHGQTICETNGQLYENEYYLQINDLQDNSEYIVKMYYVIDGKKEYTKNEIIIKTPAKIYTPEEVEDILHKSMSGNTFNESDSKCTIAATQRALKLLDIDTGNAGTKSYSLQLNQIKLEYSFNSYNRYTDWDKIDGECDEETVRILKDIISVNENIEYEDFFCDFVPSPHSLSCYNKHDEKGGQFDAEQYIYDSLLNDKTAYASYLEYPFLYESPEFQEKYAEKIKENEGNEELSTYLNHRIAENKFLFSYYNRDFMDVYAVPQERLISLYYTGEVTVQTSVAFSYLVTEIPGGYPPLKISTSYRDYSLQAYFYTKGSLMKNAADNGDYWHLFRQQNSYVPGFSNHQYGIALDFQDIETFADSPLYPYLQKNAHKYGFYNYYREAWHWVYLGE